MTPPPAATATATARTAPNGTAPDRREAPDRRPPLQVVPRPRARRHRWPVVLSVAMVAASLLAVVVGHSLMAEGQVRLSGIQAALSAEQSAHHQAVLGAAKLETPSRIVAKARQQGMVSPTQINQLPRASLKTPLTTPALAPSTTTTTPTPPAATTTSSAGTSSAGTTTAASTAASSAGSTSGQ